VQSSHGFWLIEAMVVNVMIETFEAPPGDCFCSDAVEQTMVGLTK